MDRAPASRGPVMQWRICRDALRNCAARFAASRHRRRADAARPLRLLSERNRWRVRARHASAVRRFQARAGLVPDGRLNMETLAALGLLPGQHAPGFRAPPRRLQATAGLSRASGCLIVRRAAFRPIVWSSGKRTDCSSAKTLPTKMLASTRSKSRSGSSETQMLARRNFLCGSSSRFLPILLS